MFDLEYGSADSKDFWEWMGPRLDAREQAKAEARALKAEPVAPRRLPSTGQTFAPEPDARAREALEGFAIPERPKADRVRIVELMAQRHGVCG